MESINDSKFDLAVVGTGLPQSLLALALSRSEKKTLHLDPNEYYGGPNAALSLQDAEAWVKRHSDDQSPDFQRAHISVPEEITEQSSAKLGFSRAYSLALSPQIIYSRSALLPTLVSSRVHKQLDFLAVGAWWIYDPDVTANVASNEARGAFKRIPGGREDVFADKTIDLKAKRSLMKFLKSVADLEAQPQILEQWGNKSVEDYLSGEFGIPLKLLHTLHALSLSPHPPSETRVSYALPRITRHLTSIGVFGPGFGAVVPKWGGLAELCQVACRACAVGGGVYMLSQGVDGFNASDQSVDQKSLLNIKLTNNESIQAQSLVDSQIGAQTVSKESPESDPIFTARGITIVSSSLDELFPPIAEGSVPSACTVVVFPVGSLQHVNESLQRPLYLVIHSSDTGECPSGQSVIYASVALDEGSGGSKWLQSAIKVLLRSLEHAEDVQILRQLQYYQRFQSSEPSSPSVDEDPVTQVLKLPPSNNSDLAFDDKILRDVRRVWQTISGETDGFMQFEEQEAAGDDDDD